LGAALAFALGAALAFALGAALAFALGAALRFVAVCPGLGRFAPAFRSVLVLL